MLSKQPKVGETYYGPNPENPKKSWFFEVTSVGPREVFICSAPWKPRAKIHRERQMWSVSLDFFVANYRLERDHLGRTIHRPRGSAVVRRRRMSGGRRDLPHCHW